MDAQTIIDAHGRALFVVIPVAEYEALLERAGPPKEGPKVAVKLRLDPDLLVVLRATGPGWQTRVNRILRERFAL